MAGDMKAPLPIRTFEDSQHLVWVRIADASDKTKKVTVDAGKLWIRNHGIDPASVERTVRLSEQGHSSINGIYDGTTNTDPSNIALIGHVRAEAPADSNQTIRFTGVQGTVQNTVWAQDVSLHDHNGNNYTSTNPFPVTVVSATLGTALREKFLKEDLAADGTHDFTYDVPVGKILNIRSILLSCSAWAKLTLLTDLATDDDFVEEVTLYNTDAKLMEEYEWKEDFRIPAGKTVKVTVVNRDNQTQDIRALLEGELIDA